jgi:tetratricopeptide (TPR) repeat protein/predicted Ser/Thr protein kinase
MSIPSSHTWDRVSMILDSLLDRDEREWAAVLDERCGGDTDLRRQVLRLLVANRRARGFLSVPLSLAAPTLVAELGESFMGEEPAAPERVGSWRLLRELGRGGMGVVYLAERMGDQFRQRAALKLVHGGMGGGEILARFRRERQILAGLNHPFIARLLDGGCAEDGRPYLTMEYVEGRPLTTYCRERALDLEDRLRLFVEICHAVQHAHVRLVVHRDLKPSNILITDAGEPRLLDFGIAKVLAEDENGTTLTRTGLPLMTPEYAAPEQLDGKAVSTATDVYALGLILYELLAGRHPFRDRVGPATGNPTARREPPRPSLAASDRALRRRLTGDLDTIVLMALREEPARRYASAEALARDVERHLAGLPVSARPDTVGYRARKFARRHRWGVAVSAAAMLLLIAFAVAMAEQARLTARQRDRAERVSKYLVELFSVPNPLGEGGNITAREILDRGALRIDAELAAEPEVQADLLDTMGRVYRAIGVFDRAQQLLQRSVDLRSRTGGADDPRTLSSLAALGNVLVRASQFDEGIRMFRQTFERERRALGADHETTLRTMNDLAFWLGVMGRWKEAEALHRDVLERRRRRYGDVHSETVWSVSDLGVVLMRQGRYAEAEPLLAEAVRIWRRVRSPGDPDSFREAVFESSLASLYLGQKRYAEAEPIFVETLETIRRVMGPENLHTISAMKDLAVLWYSTGRLQDSETMLRKTLEISRRVLGPRHFDTLQSTYGLAVVVAGQGRLEEAEKLQLEALALQREVLGAEHPDTLLSMANLGRIRAKQGRFGEGRQLLQDAVESQTRLYGAAHPHAAESAYGLACLAALSGRPDEALDRLRQTLQSGRVDPGRVLREPDLRVLKGEPEFQRIMAAADLQPSK